jgi:hypothetical protein
MPRLWCFSTTPTRSSAPPRPGRGPAAALLALAALAACTPPAGRGLPHDALDNYIAGAIGDPGTCVLIADRGTGQVVYRYGENVTCARQLPACDRPGTLTDAGALQLIASGPRLASCDSAPGRRVGWAAGPVPGTRPLNYAAVMEVENSRALPGIEIQTRLAEAFQRAGL